MADLSLHDDPDADRVSFRRTDFQSVVPSIESRFPYVQLLYLTKIFRGTITPRGLVWLDHDREDATPAESQDLSHLLYCFEVYGQIICMFVSSGEHVEEVEELQRALADYRIRLLKLAKYCTFESLRAWHDAFVASMMKEGQDRPEHWRAPREDLTQLLRRR